MPSAAGAGDGRFRDLMEMATSTPTVSRYGSIDRRMGEKSTPKV
jgi:hypothetical protein